MKGQLPKNATKHPKNGITPKRLAAALDDLSVFVSVAENASFVEASRRMAIPTSSVSRAVTRLEDELGVQLLRRTSRKVIVTDEGQQLLLRASPLLEGLEEALTSAADQQREPSGAVRVTAPAYTGSTRVSRALAEFAAQHPKISIELDASNGIRDLLREGFDFGVRVGPLSNPDFVARRLWSGRFGLFAARSFVQSALGGRRVVERETLKAQPCVVLRASKVWRFCDSGGHETEVTPRVRFAVNDPRGALEVASRGLGIALLPVELVAANSRSMLRLQTDFGDPESLDLYIVYPTRRLLPQRVRMAIDWLSQPRYALAEASTDVS
jgi:LysR family transcriptional regulator AphB